jgi:hypothetical protein
MVVIGSYPLMGASDYVERLRLEGESWHFLITRTGGVVRCLPLTGTGFYCGRSDGPDGQHVNDYSFGVCVEGLAVEHERLAASQRQTLYELLSYLRYYDGGCPWLGMKWDVTRKAEPKPFPLNEAVLKNDLGYTIWRKRK